METNNEIAIQSPMTLIEVATKNGASIEHLEKLMNLQERWEKGQARKSFYDAKAKFQKLKPIINKTQSVDFTSSKTGMRTNYKFAPLPEIQKSVDNILADLGLSYEFKQEETQGSIKITCVLTHELGHSEESHLTALADTSGGKNAIQSIGSTVTYLKRYTLSNVLGLSTEEDNDGESAITIQEAKNLKLKVELTDLYFAKKDKLNQEQIERLEGIITNNEVSSYLKSIKHLKTF